MQSHELHRLYGTVLDPAVEQPPLTCCLTESRRCRQGANPSTPRMISTSARADPLILRHFTVDRVPRHPHDRSPKPNFSEPRRFSIGPKSYMANGISRTNCHRIRSTRFPREAGVIAFVFDSF